MPRSSSGNTGHALGACWIDYNADNWPDLFVTNGYDDERDQ